MKTIRCILFLLPVALLSACGSDQAPSTSGNNGGGKEPAQAAVGEQEAKTLFESLCFTCHGTTGKGDGPGSGALDPKPRSFSDAAWQDSVTDEQISKAIVYGGAAVGKSAIMPANPQLKGKKETLAALVKIVRGFRAK